MVIGIGTGLVALGLALPTGLAFGYGYGYGVRQGYSAFKVPGKTAMGLKQSPNPVDGSLGMGLQVAEERTNTVGLGGGGSIQGKERALMGQPARVSLKEQQKSYRKEADLERMKQTSFPKYQPSRFDKRKSISDPRPTSYNWWGKPSYKKTSGRRR